MIEASELRSLRKCVLTLRADPAAVHRPELRFVREWLRSLGAALPPAPAAVVTESESSSGSELDADLRPRASARDAALPPPPRGDPTQPTDAAARERAAELKVRMAVTCALDARDTPGVYLLSAWAERWRAG